MLMRAPNGATVDAREEAVARLVDAGFAVVGEPRQKLRRRAPRKAQKPQEKK